MSRPNPAIYGHFERLVPIRVLGRRFEVPDGVMLIRALQYIEFETGGMRSDWSRFCFNDTIGCCTFGLHDPATGATVAARACCLRVRPGLTIDTLPAGSVLLDADTAGAAGPRTADPGALDQTARGEHA